MAILVLFSIFCQQSCGLSFGIVPFVSKRSTGLVSGFVGSGGNVGGAVTQVCGWVCLCGGWFVSRSSTLLLASIA
jgi:NNP family nitrate/nitrite transporter-like MFS transporter